MFAIERETVEGGIQSLLWPKLPFVEEAGKEVYFNPILDRVSLTKPLLVRGGFIAEEMVRNTGYVLHLSCWFSFRLLSIPFSHMGDGF
jgi:hypothetical protein